MILPNLTEKCSCDGDKFLDGECCQCFGSGRKELFSSDSSNIEKFVLHIIKRLISESYLEEGSRSLED